MQAQKTQKAIASFLPQGALIQDLLVDGSENLVLNFPSPKAYSDHNHFYFGETIGRVANRISDATIQSLNGRSWKLSANSPPHALHGGMQGWGKMTWSGPSTTIDSTGKHVSKFWRRSPHGEEGYPGTVDSAITYSTCIEESGGRKISTLEIEYESKLSDDDPDDIQETIINMTNHSYFNLGHLTTIEGTKATLYSDVYLESSQEGIPTGKLIQHPWIVAAQAFTLKSSDPVVDNCFILNTNPENTNLDTRSQELRRAASFEHARTGLHLEILTTEPAFQFYTGDYIEIPASGDIEKREARAGFCVEPGRYVNACNVPEWRRMTVLRRGDVYGSRIVYRAWKE